MPLFKCDKCNCVENTALSNWAVRFFYVVDGNVDPPALCSQCDPRIGRWHGRFPREQWDEARHGPHDVNKIMGGV